MIAGGIKVEAGSLHYGVDDTLAAIADERNRILSATFEGEDEGSCGYRDDDAKHGRQGCSDGNLARSPPR